MRIVFDTPKDSYIAGLNGIAFAFFSFLFLFFSFVLFVRKTWFHFISFIEMWRQINRKINDIAGLGLERSALAVDLLLLIAYTYVIFEVDILML